MIREFDHDTAYPRSVYDWELDENMSVLPPSRPDSDTTPVSYMIAKNKILRLSSMIVDLLGSLTQHSYEEVLILDDELSQTYEELPSHLKIQTMETLPSANLSVVNRQVQLEFLYRQSVCILHRKFFTKGRVESRYARSYSRCIESALALLEQQRHLYTHAKNKSLGTSRHWYRVSYTSHDLILAAMILCLDIRHRRTEEIAPGVVNDWTPPPNVLSALEGACQIWKENKNSSPEAMRVYQVLSAMLDSLGIDEHAETIPGIDGTGQQQSQGMDMPGTEMDIDWVGRLILPSSCFLFC